MNRQYMDFVPTGSARQKVHGNVSREVNVRENVVREETIAEKRPVRNAVSTESRRASIKARTVSDDRYVQAPRGMEQQFGVIQDYETKFVETNVKKRPLGRKTEAPVKQANVKKVAKPVRTELKNNKRPVSAKPANKARAAVDADAIFESALIEANELFDDDKPKKKEKAPRKNPFVNTEKVEKRPLSGSVGRKKVIVAKEEPSEAVTIITKEKKDSKISIIVAVIITIILGATAGTVAFLLLPK